MADYIPLPVIENILSRLPVKSLLRFRCVSKQWCSLIDNPNFIRFHLNYSQQTTTNHTLVLRDCYLYTIDFPALDRAVEIDHPMKTPQIGTDLVGCCNGLICLTNGEEENEGMILYNPATKKHRKLPFVSIEFPEYFTFCERIVYGFGYDRVADDYKVLRIVQFYPDNDYSIDSDVRVYSLKGDSWRKIGGFPYFLSYKRSHGIHVNGCLHWVVQTILDYDERKLILSFDFGTEEFKIMPQPSYLDPNFHMNVDVLNGCLCVLSNYYTTKVDIWVMKEYGDAQSWTKLLSIAELNVSRSFEYFKPIAYSQNGHEVLLEQDLKYLLWHDLRHERARTVMIQSLPTSFEAYILVESLVPLDSLKKKNDQKAESSGAVAALPLKLVSNILSWLPTKSLFWFKSVCQTWNTLISDPSFVQKHLEVYNECSDKTTLILREEKLYSVDFNRLDEAVEIDHPLSCCGGWTDILGSCNGLLCLYNEDTDFALWNPLTGRYFRLPITKNMPRKDPNLCRSFIHGFGYDCTSNDYKIIRILQFHDTYGGGFVRSDIQIYSLKVNCWRNVQDFPYILCYPCPGVFTNGALYWVARQSREVDDSSNLIMAFDIGLEKCKVVTQPNYSEKNFHMSLGLIGGSVCILCHYPKHGVDIWIMNDQTGSWYQLLFITQPEVIRKFEHIKPIGYSKSGSEVLLEQDYKKFLWYNLKTKSVKYVKISGLPDTFDTEIVFQLGDGSGKCEINVPTPRDTERATHEMQRTDLMRQSSVAVADFPLDLLSNILCWLPTKSLFRFKCVCKTWNALTSDPSFVKKHLEACSKCTNRSTIILREEKLYSVDFNLLDKVVEVDHPLSHCGGWTDILGSCNGLLCLYNEEEHYALWNPLTGRYFRLSVSTNLPPKGPNLFRCFVHGFGYDSTSDDYKIIRIVDFHGNFGEFVRSDVQLYSLKANCWRKVQAFPYILSYPCTGVLANGSLYWVARQSEELDSDYYLIMAFDLGLEKCRMVPQPNYAERSFHMSLGLQGGQVCILCHYPKHRVDMWVMNCQTGSWLKLLSITQRKEIRKFEYIKPIAYSKNGSEVLLEQDYKKFLWFNLEKKTVRYVKIQGLPKSFDSEFVSGNYETDVPTQRAIQKSGNKKQRDGVDDFLSVGFKLKL